MPIIEEETEVSNRMRICFKSEKEAKRIAMEAHNKGKAICYEGSIEACETVGEKMGDEGLTVSVS
jgi:ATP-dependent Clp protease adapter protein ClpS